MPQDYYSVLLKVIEEVSNDPAQLRKLVYALAWHNLKPDSVLSRPLATATDHARTLRSSRERWNLSARLSVWKPTSLDNRKS